MESLTAEKFIFLLYFVLPGFISLKVYDLIYPSERRDFSKSLYELAAYSALNHAALFWLIAIIVSDKIYIENKGIFYLLSAIIIIIVPICWPLLFRYISGTRFFGKYFTHPIKKPWDFVFSKRESYWIIVHLKDGRKIGGKYDTDSFSSSAPAAEQIYLQEVWELTKRGVFKKKVDRSRGIIILSSEIISVELFEG